MSAISLGRLLDRTVYKEFGDRWDDKALRLVALDYISHSSHVLGAGAGVGRVPEMNFKGIAAHVTGIDPDQRVVTNPFLDTALVGFVESAELPEENFDVVICDNVLEHVKYPDRFLRGINRCMKNNAVLVAKTPNRNHYVSAIARLTPLWFHKLYNKVRGRQTEDTFGTYYHINTEQDVARYCEDSGFAVEKLYFKEGRPEYLRVLFIFYLLGFLYERIVNSLNIFAPYRCIMVVVLRKTHSLRD